MKTDELIEGDLTDRILGAAMAVSNALGTGFLESVYHKALLIALRDNGLKASPDVSMEVRDKDQPVGQFVADIVVEGRIILELKAVSGLNNEHRAQLLNYLFASGLKVGLLLNFGKPHLEWKRLVR